MDYTFERRSEARRKGLAKMGPERLREVAAKVWAKRKANGTDRPSPERREAFRAKYTETLRRNRAARAAALSPAERLAEVARRHEVYAAAARRGWRTRRRNAGQGPGPAEAATVARLYVADVEALRSYFGPDVKRSVRLALEGLALAVEVGAVRWMGDGWTLGVQRPAEAPTEPPPASAYPDAQGTPRGNVDAVRPMSAKRLDAPSPVRILPAVRDGQRWPPDGGREGRMA